LDADQFFNAQPGLPQDSGQCAGFYLAVKRNDTTAFSSAHDDMTTPLARLFKPCPFEQSNDV